MNTNKKIVPTGVLKDIINEKRTDDNQSTSNLNKNANNIVSFPVIKTNSDPFLNKKISVLRRTTTQEFIYFDNKSKKKYKSICKLGSGRFANVYKVQELPAKEWKLNTNENKNAPMKQLTETKEEEDAHPTYYAMKCQITDQDETDDKMKNEISIMLQLESDHNVIHLINHFVDDSTLDCMDQSNHISCMVLPFYETDLEEILHAKVGKKAKMNAMSVPDLGIVQNIMRQTLNGLLYIHKQLNIIHRDIKPNNILLRNFGQKCMEVVIADFGSAHVISTKINLEKEMNVNSNVNNLKDCSDIIDEKEDMSISVSFSQTLSQNVSMKDVTVDDDDGGVAHAIIPIDDTANDCGIDISVLPPIEEVIFTDYDGNHNLKSKLTAQVCLVMYRAPELLVCEEKYGFAIDIWALACIFAQMCRENSKPLFNRTNCLAQFSQVIEVLGGPPANALENVGFYGSVVQAAVKALIPMRDIIGKKYLNDSGCDLLQEMMNYNHRERITAEQALKHSFFHRM